MAKVIKSEEVSQYIKDGSTIYFTGFGMAGMAEEVNIELEKSFLETGHPRDLTIMWATGGGNFNDRGMAHFAHEGMIKRVVAGHYRSAGPIMSKLAKENKYEAFNLPQGALVTMMRDVAARRPGVISKVGLGTFVDPRVEGGKINQKARECEDLVEVIEIDQQEWLRYKSPKVDVAIIRGSIADENGNISVYREGIMMDWLSAAQAAKACGGIVIAQVEHIVKAGSIHPMQVRVPGIIVDYIVVAKSENHLQNSGTYFSPAYTGDIKVPLESIKTLELDERKIVARRSIMELTPDAVVNLGIGMPDGISVVAAEENVNHLMHLTTESGATGGVPVAGFLDFGHSINADSFIETPYQFDFYDGGGLDVAFLGSAEVDRFGNVNVSKINGAPIGCGGFINITQNAKRVVFCGTFTAGGLEIKIADGKLNIIQEGKSKKFISDVEQITFSGKYAAGISQSVLYVTERAVFQLSKEGLELIEIAPGIDIEKDILQHMDFKPIMKDVKEMPKEIFQEKWGGLAKILEKNRVKQIVEKNKSGNEIAM